MKTDSERDHPVGIAERGVKGARSIGPFRFEGNLASTDSSWFLDKVKVASIFFMEASFSVPISTKIKIFQFGQKHRGAYCLAHLKCPKPSPTTKNSKSGPKKT